MGKVIFKVTDDGQQHFLVWSSVVDAPVTFACTADEIVELWVEEAKERATEEAQRMIEQARITGSSSRTGFYSLADVVGANRAGPNESALAEDEIVEFYVRRKKEPTKKTLAEYRKGRR